MAGDTRLLQENQPTTWITEKQRTAKLLAETLPILQKGKQELSIADLSILSTIMKETEGEAPTEILSVPEGIFCAPLTDITPSSFHWKLATTYFGTIVQPSEEKGTALHYAHLQNILFIYIPADMIAKTPLHIRKEAQENKTFHHVLIVAEKGSSCFIIEEESSEEQEEDAYRSTIVEAVIHENSHVTYACLQNYDRFTTHVVKKGAHVARNGRIDWIECYFGGKYTRSTLSTFLNEDGAQSTNTTLFFGEGTQIFDLFSNTYQKGKHTFADMNAVGIVRDTARSLCKGLIKIEQQSYGSTGHQKAKTLVMDRNAQANAIPSMEIDNFDVRATHEASVGQVDKKKLFYLMSRGLSEIQARIKIVEGFFVPIIDRLPHEEIQKRIKQLVHKKLTRGMGMEEDIFDNTWCI